MQGAFLYFVCRSEKKGKSLSSEVRTRERDGNRTINLWIQINENILSAKTKFIYILNLTICLLYSKIQVRYLRTFRIITISGFGFHLIS